MDSVSVLRQVKGGSDTDDGYRVERVKRAGSCLRLQLLPHGDVLCRAPVVVGWLVYHAVGAKIDQLLVMFGYRSDCHRRCVLGVWVSSTIRTLRQTGKFWQWWPLCPILFKIFFNLTHRRCDRATGLARRKSFSWLRLSWWEFILLLRQRLELADFRLFSYFSVATEDNLIGSISALSLLTFSVLAKSCIKRQSLIAALTSFLISSKRRRLNNVLETIHFTAAFIKYDCDHRSKHCNMTSSTAPRLKNGITVGPRNRADAIIIPFHAVLLPSWNILTKNFSI